jgi:hypothetical protein
VAIGDWDWTLPADPQDYPWDCAACSTAWCLRAIGLDYSEDAVIQGLGGSRITRAHGLMDASGAGLVAYLAEIGIGAENNPAATFDDCLAAGGYQPMVIGGRAWCHWVAVRMGGAAYGRPDLGVLALMNPADGYMGISQMLGRDDFDRLGPFSAVWFTSW